VIFRKRSPFLFSPVPTIAPLNTGVFNPGTAGWFLQFGHGEVAPAHFDEQSCL
jgi:hypothetical protein